MLHSLKQPDSNKPVVPTFYGIYGHLLKEDTGSLAKSIKSPKSTRYFCKFHTTGVEAGHLVNPWSMYSDSNTIVAINKDVINKRTGRAYFEYQEVSEELFNLYRP
jgi:hypothetical protein